MINQQHTVLIVGGGTAGWLTAAIIAAHHKTATHQNIKIVLIESSNIATVGVGEGTWPTLKQTVSSIGLTEKILFERCFATFKQASKFVGWRDDSNGFYYHPFTPPAGFGKLDFAPYLKEVSQFDQVANFQRHVCELGLAPRMLSEKEFSGRCNYGYHFDAGAFAELLKEHCTKNLNVEHIVGDVSEVITRDNQEIANLILKDKTELSGDLYIDCTGFKSLLLGESLNVGSVDTQKWLFNDSALAVQVPYSEASNMIACQTISTTHEAGWIWDIGLQHRRGVGCVFSSQHMSVDEATQKLADYTGCKVDQLAPKHIHYKSGYKQQFWKNNCVAVGLSAGFIEPMEATAILLIEQSAKFIAENIPRTQEQIGAIERLFNNKMHKHWQSIIDFLKLHYLSAHKNGQYWKQQRQTEHIPESLQERLLVWQTRGPQTSDFDSENELFTAASYQYVLYGLGMKPDFPAYLHDSERVMQQLADSVSAIKTQIEGRHLSHRDFINQWLQTH